MARVPSTPPKLVRTFLLDASSAAFGSEDFGTHNASRWAFQLRCVASLLDIEGLGTSSAAESAQCEHADNIFVSMGKPVPRVVPTIPDAHSSGGPTDYLAAHVTPGGSPDVVRAFRLALLTGRVRKSSRIIAFLASEVELDGDELRPLARSLRAAGVEVDVVLLGQAGELGAAATAALEEFIADVNCSGEPGSSDAGSSDVGSGAAPAHGASRLLRVCPPGPGADPVHHAEALAQELFFPTPSPCPPAASAPLARTPHRSPAAPPPPVPLLRGRSGAGAGGPSLCRYESLDALAHLSSDGFMRPWLPSYSNAAKSGAFLCVRQGGSDLWYLYVYSYPKWRTLLEVPAGRMRPAPAAAQSALQPAAVAAPAQARAQVAEAGGQCGAAALETAPAAAVGQRFVPDTRRGRLRLLQSNAHPAHFKLTWQEAAAAPDTARMNMFEQAESRRQQAMDDAEWEVKLSAGSSGVRISGLRQRATAPDDGAGLLSVHSHGPRSARRGADAVPAAPTTASPSNAAAAGAAAGVAPTPQHSVFWLQQRWAGPGGAAGAEGLAARLVELVRCPPPPPAEASLEEAMREGAQPVKIGPFPIALVRALLDSKLRARGGSGGGGSKRGLAGGEGGGGLAAYAPRAPGGCSKAGSGVAASKHLRKLAKPGASSPALLPPAAPARRALQSSASAPLLGAAGGDSAGGASSPRAGGCLPSHGGSAATTPHSDCSKDECGGGGAGAERPDGSCGQAALFGAAMRCVAPRALPPPPSHEGTPTVAAGCPGEHKECSDAGHEDQTAL